MPESVVIDYDMDQIARSFLFAPNQLSQDQLDEIKRKLHQGMHISDAFADVPFSFPICEQFLEEYSKLKDVSPEIAEFLAIIALYSFMGWAIQAETGIQKTKIDLILNSLLFATSTKYEILARNCFTASINTFMVNCQSINDQLPYTPISNFLMKFGSFKFIDAMIVKLVNRKCHPSDPFYSQLLATMSYMIHQKLLVLEPENALQLIEYFGAYIANLDPATFNLFGDIVTYLNDESINAVLNAIISNFFNIIQKDSPLIIKEGEECERFPLNVNEISPYLDFAPKQTFPNGFDLLKLFEAKPIGDINAWIGHSTIESISLITNTIRKCQHFADMFFSSMVRLLNAHALDEWFYSILVVIYACAIKVEKHQIAIHLGELMVHPKIFNKSSEIGPEMNTIRQCAIQFFISDDSCSHPDLLFILSQFPDLFEEFLIRMISSTHPFIDLIIKHSSILHTLIKISLFYQQLDFKAEKCYENIRSTLFTLISHLLNDENVIRLLFETQESTTAYLSFIYEDPVYPWIIGITRQYLRLDEVNYVPTTLIEFIANITCRFPDQKSLVLCSKLISDILAIVSNERYLAPVFQQICWILCENLPKIDQSQESLAILNNSLSFFANLGDIITLTNIEANRIYLAIKIFEDTNNLYYNLVQLLAGGGLSTVSPYFIIKQPNIIQVLINTYKNSTKISEILDFLTELVKFDPLNPKICSRHEIDIFILDLIIEVKGDVDFDSSNMQKLLNIFTAVANKSTSAKALNKFLSLFIPINKKYIPKFYPMFIASFNDMINHSLLQMPVSYKMDSDKEYEVTSFTHYDPRFVATFWVYLKENEETYQPRLFSLKIGATYQVMVKAINNCLHIETTDSLIRSKGRLTTTIPTMKWVFVSIFFELTAVGLRCETMRNMENTEICTLPLRKLPEDMTFKLSFGGGDLGTKYRADRFALLGIFTHFEPEVLPSIFETNRKNKFNNPFPINVLAAITNFKQCPYVKFSDFTRFFRQNLGIMFLFPLMSFPEAKFQDEKSYPYSFTDILNIILNLLLADDESQNLFMKQSGTHILSYIIQKFWINQFTFKIYNMIYSFTVSLSSEQLQKQFFDNVLMNFDILIKLEHVNHIRILRHWQQNFPIPTSRTFQEILQILQCYYWHTPSDGICKERNESINIRECRIILLDLLIRLTEDGLNDQQFDLFLSYCYSCNDEQQTEEFIKFMSIKLHHSPEIFKFDFTTGMFLSWVITFIESKSLKFQHFGLKMLIRAQEQKLISISYYCKAIKVLFRNYPTQAANLQNYEYLTKKEVIPLRAYVVCFLKPQQLDSFMKELDLKMFKKDNIWMDWFPYLCRCLRNTHQEKLMKIASQVNKEWDLIFATMEDRHLRKKAFLMTICLSLIKKTTPATDENIANFFRLVKLYIFQDTKQKIRIVNEVWADCDLAHCIVEMYIEFAPHFHLRFILLLIAYMIRNKDPDAHKLLSSIKLTDKEKEDYSIFIEYIVYQSKMVNCETNISDSFRENGQFIEEIQDFIKTAIIPQEKIQSTDIPLPQPPKIASKEVENYWLLRQKIMESNMSKWNHLNKILTHDLAPYSTRTIEYKMVRDPTAGFALVPVKLMRKGSSMFTNAPRSQFSFAFQCELANEIASISFLDKYFLVIHRSTSRSIRIGYNEIKHVFDRSPTNCDIITQFGFAISVSYPMNERDKVFNHIPPNRIRDINDPERFFKQQKFTEKWVNGEASNFEYIIILNHIAGRSFISPERYPVFPLIVDAKRELGKTLNNLDSYSQFPMNLEAVKMYNDNIEGRTKHTLQDFLDFAVKNQIETIPEFYSMSSIFGSVEFVYQQRKLLESPQITKDLPEWISLVFSPHLFVGQHPHRNLNQQTKKTKINDRSVKANKVDAVIFGSQHIEFFDKSGFLFRHGNQEQVKPVTCDQIIGIHRNFVFFRLNKNIFSFLNTKTKEKTNIRMSSRVSCVASDEPWIIVCTHDASIDCFLNLTIYRNQYIYREVLTQCAVSASFKTIAGTTESGLLIILSITHGRIVNTIQIDNIKPYKITITQAWGFILIACSEETFGRARNFVLVYTINGLFIKKIEIDFKIHQWTTWRSNDAFDYVCMTNESGDLYIGEAYYLEKMKFVTNLTGKSAGVNYSKERETLEVVLTSGKVLVIPA